MEIQHFGSGFDLRPRGACRSGLEERAGAAWEERAGAAWRSVPERPGGAAIGGAAWLSRPGGAAMDGAAFG